MKEEVDELRLEGVGCGAVGEVAAELLAGGANGVGHAVHELADSSVNIIVRLWTKTEDYWGVYFDLTEKAKKAFDKEGITIPYPQVQMHQ